MYIIAQQGKHCPWYYRKSNNSWITEREMATPMTLNEAENYRDKCEAVGIKVWIESLNTEVTK